MRHFAQLTALGVMLLAANVLFTLICVPTTSTAHASPAKIQAAINGCPPDLQNGSTGTWVQILQFRLNALHAESYFASSRYTSPLSTDGNFGSQTEGAVKDFQASSQFLSVDGQVGAHSWTTLGFCAATNDLVYADGGNQTFTHCPSTLTEGDSGTLVSGLQSLLNSRYNLHYFSTSPYPFTAYLTADGSFGGQTFNAVKDFQTVEDSPTQLIVDGQVGNHTWSALGMCY